MFTQTTIQVKKVIVFFVLKNGIYSGVLTQNLLYTWMFNLVILILGMNIMQASENAQTEKIGQITQDSNTANLKSQEINVQEAKPRLGLKKVPARKVGEVVDSYIMRDKIKHLEVKEDNEGFIIIPNPGSTSLGWEHIGLERWGHIGLGRCSAYPLSEEQQTLYGEDENAEEIQVWLNREKENCEKLDNWLGEYQVKNGTNSITNILYSEEYGALRVEVIKQFGIR